MPSSVLQLFRRFTTVAAATAMLAPLVLLLNLLVGDPLATWLQHAAHPMRPLTAVAVFLTALSLWMLRTPAVSRPHRLLAQAAAVIAGALAAGALLEYPLGFIPGADNGQWWEFWKGTSHNDAGPWRITPPIAVAILFLNGALLRLDAATVKGQVPAQYAALIAGTIGGVAVVGYLYDIQHLYKIGAFSTIAWLSALLVLVLAVGILCARSTQGFMATVATPRIGGWMLRRVLPLVLILPLLAGWIRIIAQQSGSISFKFSVGIAVACVMLIFLALLWLLAETLNRTDEQKQHLLQILQQREARHRLAVKAGRMGTFHHELAQGTIVWSPEAQAIFGAASGRVGEAPEDFEALLHPDDRGWVRGTIQSAIETRAAYEFECRLHQTGEHDETWIAVAGQVLADTAGRPRHITGVVFDVSGRKRADAAVRQSEAQLRTITDALPGLISYIDREERYRFVNAEYERFYGKAREQILGRKVADVMGDNYAAVRSHLRRALAGERVSYEVTTLSRGMEQTFHATYVPDRTSDDTVAGLYVLITNLSEYRRTEQALRDSEGRFRHLFDQASDGIVLADLKGRYLDINERGCQMLGYRRDELLRTRITRLLAPSDLFRLRETARVLLDGHRHSGEWSVQRKDGSWFSVEVSAKLQPDKRWHAIVRDITDRKRLETGLRESEAHFRMLADATPLLVSMSGVDGGATWFNRSWLVYTAGSPDDVTGSGWLDYVHPDERTDCAARYHALLARRESFELDYRLRKADGTYGSILHRGVPLVRPTGDFAGYLHTGLDITERKVMELQLQEWNEELERRVEDRTEALTHMQRRLRALASDLSTTEQQERRRLATELHDYLAQLLVVGRMKLGQARPQIRDAETLKILDAADEVLSQSLTYTRSLVAELSPQVLYQFGLPAALKWLGEHMRTHGLDVVVHCEPGRPHIPENHAVILFQGVRELLFNIVKHAQTDAAVITMAFEGPTALSITVSDDGLGFDPDQLRETAQTAGSGGFGLFNVQERIEAIGGLFDVHSVPGAGTSITITVPLDRAAPESAPSEMSADAERMQTASPRLRVLLVDDHAMVRQGLRSVLEGYEDLEVVGEAGDGEAAVAMVEALAPHVVVMDVNMPKMDGIEATRRIVNRHPHIVVIGLSVQSERHIESGMRRAGAAAFLTKEHAASQLHEAIINAVGERT